MGGGADCDFGKAVGIEGTGEGIGADWAGGRFGGCVLMFWR